MLNFRQHVLLIIVTACLAVVSSGCSLVNPYVRAEELDVGGSAAAGLPISNLPGNQALLSAITIAAAQRSAYYGAVSERAKLRNALPLILIPLSAAALYKGLSGDGGVSTRKILLKEGLVGASVFGLGGYYTSTARELTYLAGAKALSCSIYAMTPYYIPDGIGQRLSTANIEALIRQLALVTATMQQVRKSKQDTNAADTDAQAFLAGEINRFEPSIAAARKVLLQALETQTVLDDAGARLRVTVENLVAEVNSQIARSEPDPAIILTMISSLPTIAKQFAPTGSFTAAGPAPDKSFKKGVSGTATLALLADQVKDLEALVVSMQWALDVIGQRIRATPALQTCQVQGSQGRLDISPGDAVEMRPGETIRFVVRSTSGIPSVEWVGLVSAQLEMKKALSGDTLIVEVTYKAAVEGLTHVTIQAATKELEKQVNINLLPAIASVKKDATKTDTVKIPQANTRSIGVKQDGTKPGIGSAKQESTESGAENAFEKGLSSDKIQALQAKLNVPKSGRFDAQTRAAITKWQKDNFVALRDGKLQSRIYDQIMK